jgi:hypothetical protein
VSLFAAVLFASVEGDGMKVEQRVWRQTDQWQVVRPFDESLREVVQLVLVFGHYDLFYSERVTEQLRRLYPVAHILGCSACGAIQGAEIEEESLVATAVYFERTTVRLVAAAVEEVDRSFAAGKSLADQLKSEGLVHVFVLSDGLRVDGDALARGLAESLPGGVMVTGGLAGDLEKFEDTCVIADGGAMGRVVAAVGFYGDALSVGHGCFGGWDSFGISRTVTRAEGNVLYEIDGESALSLYKRYLGDLADGLPGTALYFPLNLTKPNSRSHLVRSVLSVDEENDSLIFAGDIPNGSTVTLMKANVNRLVVGALRAGEMSIESLSPQLAELTILVSCAARKMVLKQRTEEELEAVQEVLCGAGCMAGFYSFGEICPAESAQAACALHNQTMTITTLSETCD